MFIDGDTYQPDDPEIPPKDPQLVDIGEIDAEEIIRTEEITWPEIETAFALARARSQCEADGRQRSAPTLFLEEF